MKLPSDQFDKTLPVWTKAVGGDPITNALSRSGNILYSDPTLIQDNAAAWGQLLGSRDVALYYMSRSPKLLTLNQQTRSKCWQALLDVLKAKPLVFWVMHQSCVPQRVEVLGRSTYGSAFQGTYTRIDGCKVNDKVVYVKDEIVPPKPKVGSGPGPEFESPSSRRERREKEARGEKLEEEEKVRKSLDEPPEIKVPRTVMYMLLDEQQRWQITPTKTPTSKIPLVRVPPIVIRNLETIDGRAILDPTQNYMEHFPWELRQGGGKFAEDRKLKVVTVGEDKFFTAKPLFYLTPDTIRASYGVLKEMLGPVWVVNDNTLVQYRVCPDLRKKDAVFGDGDPEATEVHLFKRLGAFSALKNYIYLQPDQYREDGQGLEETSCELVCWDPVTVYLLFYRTVLAEEDELETEVPWLSEWTEEIGMMLPRVDLWKGGRFRVFAKTFPRGTTTLRGCGAAVRPPLVYCKVGAYGFSVTMQRGLFVNYTQKLGDAAFCITDPDYDAAAVAARDEELEENPEPEPQLEDEDEQKLAMKELFERQTAHLHVGDYQLLMLGSFDAFNDYTFLQLPYEDVTNSGTTTDTAQYTLQVAKPVTVFLCYLTDNIPDDVRVWHVTECWKTDERLKPPIVRHRKTREDLTAVQIRLKDFPAGEIRIKSSQGALMVNLYLQRQDVAPGYQLAGSWVFRLGKVSQWVRDLKLELLGSFKILSADEIDRAVELHPEILRATGPHLTAAFRTMVDRDVFGGKQSLRCALQKCPLLLQVEARVIIRAQTLIQNVFQEESPVLFEAHPDLLQLGDAIQNLLDKLYAMFPVEFVRHRLQQSVKEVNLWQQWYTMLRKSSTVVDEWIGALQPYEDTKAVVSSTGKVGW
eukprot:g13113.t1